MRSGAILLLMVSLLPEPLPSANRPEPDRAKQEPAVLAGAHNLQAGGSAGAETCSFCHTPEGAPGPAPRWARSASATAYTAFDVRGADGGISVSGPTSVACLACHDGVQADEIGAEFPLAAPMRSLAGGGHPVGIPYAGDARSAPDGAVRPARLQREEVGGRVSWWLDLERVPNGVRDKSDAILFVRGDDPTAQPFIECATCHDPHSVGGRVMLRNPEAGSNLCLACHNR